jgi:hypothetical protein
VVTDVLIVIVIRVLLLLPVFILQKKNNLITTREYYWDIADGCSSRPSAKPRPERPDWNPESHLPRIECTPDYAELFCYNGQCYMQMNINGYNEPYCK